MAKFEDNWDINKHTRQGDGSWKFNDQCVKKGRGFFGRPDSCCGNTFPDMIPQQKVNHKLYNQKLKQFNQRVKSAVAIDHMIQTILTDNAVQIIKLDHNAEYNTL